MSNAVAEQTKPVNIPPARAFRQSCERVATSLLTDWVGEDRANEAIGRVSTALSAAALSAKKPEDFYACTQESVGAVVAISALTGIMVSTARNSLAYAIPQRPRKNAPFQLNYRLSHRGVAALAQRSGQRIIAIPVNNEDSVSFNEFGEIKVESIDADNPPITWDELRGIVVLIKDINSGAVVFPGWVPKKIIEKRRQQSTAYRFALENDWARESDPWHVWPVEQSMKTAMHYAISRGWCVIDDTESIRALSMDEPVLDGQVVSRKQVRTSELNQVIEHQPVEQQSAESESDDISVRVAELTEQIAAAENEDRVSDLLGIGEQELAAVEPETERKRLMGLLNDACRKRCEELAN